MFASTKEPPSAPSDEGAVGEADWGRDKKDFIFLKWADFKNFFSPSASHSLGTSLIRGRRFQSLQFIDSLGSL